MSSTNHFFRPGLYRVDALSTCPEDSSPAGPGRVCGLSAQGIDGLSLVRRRALAQLQVWAPALQKREGWAWVDVALVFDVHVWQAYLSAPTRRKAATPEAAESLAALRLQQRRSERLLDEVYRLVREGTMSAALREAQEGRLQALELQCLRHAVLVEEMQASQKACVPEIADWVGALMTFDRSGWVLTKRHLVRKEEWPQMNAALRSHSVHPHVGEPVARWVG